MTAINLEKRRYPRFSVDLPLEYWKTYNPLSQSSCLINISEGGVLIHLAEPLEIGEYLKLRILTDARLDSDSIEALVKVIWKDTHSGNGDGYRIGAKFVGISPEDMDKFKNLLNTLKNRPAPSSKILSRFTSIFPSLSSPNHREVLDRKVHR